MEREVAVDSVVGLRDDSLGRGALVRAARIVVSVTLFAAVLYVAANDWGEVSDVVATIGPMPIVAALGLTLAGLVASALTWRASLRELGSSVSPPEAMKIYLVGQLGKYIPGSVWALVVQMELARSAGVRRTHAFGAGVVAVGINILTGSALGLSLQPFLGDPSTVRYAAAALGVAGCAVVLAPPILGRLANFALRRVKQPGLDRPPGWAGVLKAAGLSLSSWLLYGLALSILAIGAGAEPAETLVLALPAVALAMTVGFLVAVAPSGIGVREAVLVGALAPVLDSTTALGVALVLRLVFTVADLAAALGTVPIRIPDRAAPPITSGDPQPQNV